MMRKKRPHLVEKSVLFHENHARKHMFAVVEVKICSEFSPQWLLLFPNVKKGIGGTSFGSNDEIIVQKNTNNVHPDLKIVKKLEKYWAYCMELKGD